MKIVGALKCGQQKTHSMPFASEIYNVSRIINPFRPDMPFRILRRRCRPNSDHRHRKVLNMVGGKFQNIGGEGVGEGVAGCKLIGAPAPQSVPDNYISHIKTDNIAKSRIQLKSKVLEIPSNKINGTHIKLVHLCSSFTVSHRQ